MSTVPPAHAVNTAPTRTLSKAVSSPGSTSPTTSIGTQPQPQPLGRIAKRPAPRGTAAYPRKRANKACQVCRARRTKCDNKRPSCSFCEKAETTCTWAPHDLSSFDPASLAILERFDHLESLILSNTGCASQKPVAPVAVHQDANLEKRLGCVQNDLINVRLEAVFEWEPIQRCLEPNTFLIEPCVLPHYQRTNGLSDEFDMNTCNRLLDRFWKGVHSKNPILAKDEIRRFIHHVCINGIGWDAQSCLILLIFALGTLATNFGPHSASRKGEDCEDERPRIAQAQQYFAASQKRLVACFGKSGLLEAQCFFYSGVYHVTMMQPDAGWSMFLQALASCRSFRCLTQGRLQDDTSSDLEYELDNSLVAEECTYWTCLKSELECRLDLNPPGFRAIDLWYPRKFPGPPRDMSADSDKSWFFYLAEIALRRLANRIMNFISRGYNLDNPQQAHAACEIATEFEREAQDWVHSLPSPNELDKYQDDVLNFILKGHLMNCYELIYWPFVKQSINGIPVTLINQEHIKKGLQIAVERIEINQPGFKHRHHGTHGMIRAVTRSAFVLLAAHLSGILGDFMPEGWFNLLSVVDEMLEFWQEEVTDARMWRAMMRCLINQAQI